MTLTLDPSSTAPVPIEYQNDLTSEGGAGHGAVDDVMKSTGRWDKNLALVEAAGRAVVTVMHAPITLLPDCTAATAQAEQESAIRYHFPMFSVPLSAQEVKAALEAVATERAA
jgi:hypothetical protein